MTNYSKINWIFFQITSPFRLRILFTILAVVEILFWKENENLTANPKSFYSQTMFSQWLLDLKIIILAMGGHFSRLHCICIQIIYLTSSGFKLSNTFMQKMRNSISTDLCKQYTTWIVILTLVSFRSVCVCYVVFEIFLIAVCLLNDF